MCMKKTETKYITEGTSIGDSAEHWTLLVEYVCHEITDNEE